MEFRFFEIYRDPSYLLVLGEGAAMSSALAIGGGILGFGLALILAGLRYAKITGLAQIATAYVEFIRNTPLIVQLFFVAFGLPMLLGYRWPFWGHALLAFTLNFSAYFSEILRAGFATVGNGQREAAEALGLKKPVIFFRIIVPQAIAQMVPSLNSQFIFLFLTTGVVAEIGVRDLTHAGLFIDSRTFRSFEVFLTLTVMYVGIALAFKAALTSLAHYAYPWKVSQ